MLLYWTLAGDELLSDTRNNAPGSWDNDLSPPKPDLGDKSRTGKKTLLILRIGQILLARNFRYIKWFRTMVPNQSPTIDIPFYELGKYLVITSLIIGSSIYVYNYFYPNPNPLIPNTPRSHGPYISAENKPIHFHEHVQCIAYYQHNEKFEFSLDYEEVVEEHLGRSALVPIERDYFVHPFFYYYYKPGKHIINEENLLYSLDAENNPYKKLDIVLENSEFFRRALVEHKYYPVIWWRNPLYVHELRPYYHYKFYKINDNVIVPEKQQLIFFDPVISCFNGENVWRPHLYRKHRDEITQLFASKDNIKGKPTNWEDWWDKHDLFNLKQDWVDIQPTLITDFDKFSDWVDNLMFLKSLHSIIHSPFFVSFLTILIFVTPLYPFILKSTMVTHIINIFKKSYKFLLKK